MTPDIATLQEQVRELSEALEASRDALLAAQEASDFSDACKDLDTIPRHVMDKAAQLFNRARQLRTVALARMPS